MIETCEAASRWQKYEELAVEAKGEYEKEMAAWKKENAGRSSSPRSVGHGHVPARLLWCTAHWWRHANWVPVHLQCCSILAIH